VAGPYSWVASGGGYCIVCVILFAAGFQFGYLGRVSCSSQLVFEMFIGVHGLALIQVRFLFLLLVSSSLPGWMPMQNVRRAVELVEWSEHSVSVDRPFTVAAT